MDNILNKYKIDAKVTKDPEFYEDRQLNMENGSTSLIEDTTIFSERINPHAVLAEYFRILVKNGNLLISERTENKGNLSSLAAEVGFQYVESVDHDAESIMVFMKPVQDGDNVNYEYLQYIRDKHFRDQSQRLISEIIKGFENIIVDINGLNKIEMTAVSIIKSITLYTKNSIENVKQALLRLKSDDGKIEILAKRISQNKVMISCPMIGFEITIYNIFKDFDHLYGMKNRIPLMLEHSYHTMAYLETKELEREYKKIKFLEGQFFTEKPVQPKFNYIPRLPMFFRDTNNMIIIGLHKYGFKIGPMEIIYTGNENIPSMFNKGKYNVNVYEGDRKLRGPFYSAYNYKSREVEFRIYAINNRCIPTDNYTVTMKFLMNYFIFPRPEFGDMKLLKGICAHIILEYSDTVVNYNCLGIDQSDQYRYEVQVWRERKWLFKITI